MWQDWQRNAPQKKNIGHDEVGSIGQEKDGDSQPQLAAHRTEHLEALGRHVAGKYISCMCSANLADTFQPFVHVDDEVVVRYEEYFKCVGNTLHDKYCIASQIVWPGVVFVFELLAVCLRKLLNSSGVRVVNVT